MNKIEWYQSATLRALLVAMVSQIIVWTGVAESVPLDGAAIAVDAVLQVVAMVATAYAAWSRARKANPPVTEIAVRRTEAMITEQANESNQ